MFDIGFSELLLIAVAALIAIGPKDLPEVLFRLGRITRQIKMFMNDVRNEYSEIMHEAEVNHYRKQIEESLNDEAAADRHLAPPPASPSQEKKHDDAA